MCHCPLLLVVVQCQKYNGIDSKGCSCCVVRWWMPSAWDGRVTGIWHHVKCMEPGERLKMRHLLACLGWDHWWSSACGNVTADLEDLETLGCPRLVPHALFLYLFIYIYHYYDDPIATRAWMWNFYFPLNGCWFSPLKFIPGAFIGLFYVDISAVWDRAEGDQIGFSCSLL